jgi:hypothetical protein
MSVELPEMQAGVALATEPLWKNCIVENDASDHWTAFPLEAEVDVCGNLVLRDRQGATQLTNFRDCIPLRITSQGQILVHVENVDEDSGYIGEFELIADKEGVCLKRRLSADERREIETKPQ